MIHIAVHVHVLTYEVTLKNKINLERKTKTKIIYFACFGSNYYVDTLNKLVSLFPKDTELQKVE